MKKNIKEEFISTLSHEIRTPLTSIKGFSETLLNSWDKIEENKKKEFLSIILGQSKRLINLVENVLNAAKIDSEENIIPIKIDISNLLKNCINIVKNNYKNFEFNLKEPKNKLYCLSDNDKTQQIVLNILDNAAKYSKNSTKIDIDISPKEDFIKIRIKNYGSFIDKKDYEKVFEKFTRLDSYITSSVQGSGLGLYIVKNLIEKMQGKIEINSSKEKCFCEFIVYLPSFEVEKITKI